MECHLAAGNYARALAVAPADGQEIWRPWAYFRLGMYRSVVSLPTRPWEEQYLETQLLPSLFSLAACGERERLEEVIRLTPWRAVRPALKLAVAKYLSLYVPEVAVRLLQGVNWEESPAAYLLVLARAGRSDQVQGLLEGSREWQCVPVLRLFDSVFGTSAPEQHVRSFNSVLVSYGLQPVALIDENQPFSVANIQPCTRIQAYSGPPVSVIMTTFNSAGCVGSAIESVLAQSYTNLELIIVDDGSSDETPAVLESYRRRDPRVTVVPLERNCGTYCAKSVGLRYAHGDFVTCMDSDDWSHPLKIERQIAPLLRDPGLVATMSGCVVSHDDGKTDIWNGSELLLLNHSSVLFRRQQVLSDTGAWDAGVRVSADSEFIHRLRLVYGAAAIEYVPEPLSLISRRAGTLTQTRDGAGFGQGCFPPWRLHYFESYNRWHIDCYGKGELPKVNSDLVHWIHHRPFPVHEKIRVRSSPHVCAVALSARMQAAAESYVAEESFARALVMAKNILASMTEGRGEAALPAWYPWASFRLGMYSTTATFVTGLCDNRYLERQLLPCSVALAAIGDTAAARALIDQAPWDRLPQSLPAALAKHLSSYDPGEALRLLDLAGSEVSPVIHILVLLRAGQFQRARQSFKRALAAGRIGEFSALCLFGTIVDADTSNDRLHWLNRVYDAYALGPLRLRDDGQPLNPTNVETSSAPTVFDGPLVSVLMTTFNVESRVSAAIESILSQSYRNVELIVVDDRSTDRTPDIIRQYSDRDARVSFIQLKRNVGTYGAKSLGLKYAKGEFVTCMDADDWSHPLKLEWQTRPLLDDPSLIATTSNWIRLSDFGEVDIVERVDLVNLNYSSLLFRRNRVVSEIGGWDCCARTGADVEIIRRMHIVYGPESIRHVPAPLSLGARRGDSLTMARDGTGFVGNVFPVELLKYIEAFNCWHMDMLRTGRLPKLPVDMCEWIDNHAFIFPSVLFAERDDLLSVASGIYLPCAEAGESPGEK